MSALILIMGDQLSFDIPALKAADKSQDIVLLAELRDEASYVQHHKKKIAFSVFRPCGILRSPAHAGWQVDYIPLTDADNTHSFTNEAERALRRHHLDEVVATHPSEYRVLQLLKTWQASTAFFL